MVQERDNEPAMDRAADEEEVVKRTEQHGGKLNLQLRLVVPEDVVDAQVAQQRQQEQHEFEQHELDVEAARHDHQAERQVDELYHDNLILAEPASYK